MKIFVVNEPFVKDFCRTQRWAARTRGRVLRAPDWLAYATAVLEEEFPDADIRLFDFPAKQWTRKEYLELLEKESPDFVILDSTTPSINSDLWFAGEAKKVGAKVIMVGPHCSSLPEETITKSNGAVDVVCIGEYDFTIRDVIKSFPELSNVLGICFIKDEHPNVTAHRDLVQDLDTIPFPAWHHLNLMDYFDGGKLFPYITVISGRGCPNRCVFCLWPQVMHGFNYRLRSPKNVVDEIERDIKLCPQVLKTGEFFFEDDTFTVRPERAIAICNEIMSRGLKIRFSVNGRVDCFDPEMLKVMKKAGCREILVGFESGNQEMLNRMRKGITLEQSREFMVRTKEAGIDVHGCFVVGLPGETPETARETIDFALGLGLHTAQFSGAVPFPGTELFELCEKEGWLLTHDWSKWLDNGEQQGVVAYPTITQEQINELVDEGLKRFYFRPSYLLNFLFSTRSKADLYRKLRGGKNFLSYLMSK